MPTYDFDCSECGARFERLVPVEQRETDCPECGAAGAERQISGFGLISRQPTSSQRRAMEDTRGTNRDGARTRWKQSLAKGRAAGKAQRKPPR